MLEELLWSRVNKNDQRDDSGYGKHQKIWLADCDTMIVKTMMMVSRLRVVALVSTCLLLAVHAAPHERGRGCAVRRGGQRESNRQALRNRRRGRRSHHGLEVRGSLDRRDRPPRRHHHHAGGRGTAGRGAYRCRKLQQDTAQRLAAFVRDAAVTVAVQEVNSYRFTVAGNVERPGLFTSRSYVTVSEALALAGGPNRYASTDDIVIVRTAGGHGERRIPINYDDILSGKSPEQDIVLLAGDAVRVP